MAKAAVVVMQDGRIAAGEEAGPLSMRRDAEEELRVTCGRLQARIEELEIINGALAHRVEEMDRANSDFFAAEERLRELVEGIPQLVWRAADGGHWTWCSRQWTAFTGQPEERALGRGWLEMVHPDDRQRMSEAWLAAVGSGRIDIDHRLWNAPMQVYRYVRLRAASASARTDLPPEWFGTMTDVHELLALQHHQEVLLHELRHRVRNTLALTRSIATRTARSSENVEAFRERLEGRLGAMARTQDILTSAADARATLDEMLRDEIAAGGGEVGGNVELSGPAVTFSGKAAESFGLAVHELATNAAKHGALSADGGRLKVTWSIRPEKGVGRLLFRWLESGVKVGPVERRGFGSELIENAVPYDLQGTGRLIHRSTGVSCEIDIPLSENIRLEKG